MLEGSRLSYFERAEDKGVETVVDPESVASAAAFDLLDRQHVTTAEVGGGWVLGFSGLVLLFYLQRPAFRWWNLSYRYEGA